MLIVFKRQKGRILNSNNHTILVCGAGHQGLSMAAHLSLNGFSVNLWNRTEENIKELLRNNIIHCSGVVKGDAKISKVSSDISSVLSDFIMITTPSNSHRELAQILSPYVTKDTYIILNPGRTFGAIEFAEELMANGVRYLPHIAETQTIVYTCRKSGTTSTTIFALKDNVAIASLKGFSISDILQRIPTCIRSHFSPVASTAYTSLSNVGMILHCAPVVMNVGWIECEKVDFKYYYDGISRSVATYIEKLDKERLQVARAAGYEVESLMTWLKKSYHVSGSNLYECIRNNTAYKEIDAPKTINTRYIYEDVPNGLVPIEFIGQELGVDTPNISTVITIASNLMNTDYRSHGRSFNMKMLQKYF